MSSLKMKVLCKTKSNVLSSKEIIKHSEFECLWLSIVVDIMMFIHFKNV